MHPEPIFNFFGIPIYGFGIFAALALAAGYSVTGSRLERDGLERELLPDLAFTIMLPAFAGARMLFVLTHLQDYSVHPLGIFRFWEGGLVLYGGLLGGLVGAFYFMRRRSVSFLKYGDAIALGLALGFATSRIGCFLAGCCYGKPTLLPWGIQFIHTASLARPLGTPLHPTQLYLFLAEFSIFLLLLFRKKKFNGENLVLYFLLTSGLRLGIDFLRADTSPAARFFVFLFFAASFGAYILFKTNKGEIMSLLSRTKTATLLLATIFFAACGIVSTQTLERGHNIRGSEVNQLVKGQSTEKDVLKLFGPPTKVRDTEEGKEFLYEYAKSGGMKWNLLLSVGGSSATKTLIVWLDKSGVVTDYAFKTT